MNKNEIEKIYEGIDVDLMIETDEETGLDYVLFRIRNHYGLDEDFVDIPFDSAIIKIPITQIKGLKKAIINLAKEFNTH